MMKICVMGFLLSIILSTTLCKNRAVWLRFEILAIWERSSVVQFAYVSGFLTTLPVNYKHKSKGIRNQNQG